MTAVKLQPLFSQRRNQLADTDATFGRYRMVIGVDMPYSVEFFRELPIQAKAVPWGLLYGAVVGAVGSMIPAWNARKVKVSDVFARIA